MDVGAENATPHGRGVAILEDWTPELRRQSRNELNETVGTIPTAYGRTGPNTDCPERRIACTTKSWPFGSPLSVYFAAHRQS